jgi:hypothetical protein
MTGRNPFCKLVIRLWLEFSVGESRFILQCECTDFIAIEKLLIHLGRYARSFVWILLNIFERSWTEMVMFWMRTAWAFQIEIGSLELRISWNAVKVQNVQSGRDNFPLNIHPLNKSEAPLSDLIRSKDAISSLIL